MPISKPLTFIGQRVILQYIDPDWRFELYRKCPRLRAAHRVTPLKVEAFWPNEFAIHINSHAYKLGIYRHYPEATPPVWVQKENEMGGVQYDVGRFGDPKDHMVQARALKDRTPTEAERRQNLKAQKKLLELLPRLTFYVGPEDEKENLEDEVEDLQSEIQLFNEQLAISKLKFVEFIQLTTTTKYLTTIERVRYENSLQNAYEYLLEHVFCLGNKIQVNYHLRLYGTIDRNFTVKLGKFNIELEIEKGRIQSILFPPNIRLRGKFNLGGDIKLKGFELYCEVPRSGKEEEETLEAMKSLAGTEEIREQVERKSFPCTIDIHHNQTLISVEIATKTPFNPAKVEEVLTFTLTGNVNYTGHISTPAITN